MTRKTPPGAGNEHGTGKKALALLIGTICGNVGTNVSLAGPGGGVVTQGQGAISTPNSTSTVIDQASNRLSIDWQSFDVASNESVRFNQPTSNSVALNRILDQKASEVFGRIDANGRVVLFNSHGIMFGAGSQVNVGSLLATSLNVISFDESTGQLRLAAAGSPGSIINNGSITAAPGGSVSLVGGLVSNNGLIVADFGSVNLAAGRSATLDFYGGGLLRFEADSSLTENPSGAAAGVSNAGTITADGGQVLLTTSAAQNVFNRAVNNDGLVSANRIENVGGTIRLVGAGGTVVSSGVLDASGVGAGSTGGTVHVLGENVGLFGNAVVDVSGDAGGGVALIGGDYQGAALDVPNASHTIVAQGASIAADAGVAGDGGRVILWSEDTTRFYGSISARGGAQSGNGGLAEVSSHGALAFGGSVRVGAPAGNGGTLLLDPDNITVNATGPDPANLDFTSLSGEDAVVGADDIEQALEDNALVFLRALQDIDINSAIDVGGNADALNSALELRAGRDVILDASITLNNGDLTISASDSGGNNDPAGTIDFSGGSINVGTGNIILSAAGNITTTTETITGGSLNVSGAVVNIDTNLGADGVGDDGLSAITTGALTVNDSGTLTVASVSAPSANITANGDLTVAMISTTGTTTLASTTGAILDDGADTTIAANDLTLNAADDIGSITNLRDGTGSALDIDVEDVLTVNVADVAGDINLRFFNQVPPGAAFSIDLGGAGDATGRILLQTNAGLAFDASALPTGSIDLGATNTAQVGLRAGGADGAVVTPADSVLTLSTNTTSLFDDNPGTFIVSGSNVIDTDAGADADTLTFAVGNLIFDSGAASANKILNTTVSQFSAAIGNGADLEVNETTGITLNSVSAVNVDVSAAGAIVATSVTANGAGNIDITATGGTNGITLGTLTATGNTVTLAAAGDIVDAVGTTPSVVANQLTITTARSADLDTNITDLTATVTTGGLAIRDQNAGLDVNAVVSGGGVDISSTGGTLNVDGAVAADGTVTLLATNGAIDVTGQTVTANLAGNISLTATGASNGITLGTLTATGNTVTLSAAGDIVDAAGATSSVNANQLTITTALSADLDTDVNDLTASVGTGGLAIRDQNTGLDVNAVTSGGGLDISSTGGTMNVDGAVTSNGTANLVATGGAIDMTGQSLTANGTGNINLTATGATNGITLGTLTATGNTVTLSAPGDIVDAAGTTPSVVANQLTITTAQSADLDTDVTALTATVTTGGLAIRDQNAGLNVNAVTSGGGATISTTGGTLNVDAALTAAGAVALTSTGGAIDITGQTVTANGASNISLTATGGTNGITLGTLNALGDTVTLAAAGDIVDAAGLTSSVNANQLTITGARSADLDTDVTSLTATVGTGGIGIRDQNAGLAVTAITAGGPVDIETAGDLTVTGTVNAGTSSAELTATAGGSVVATGGSVSANNGITVTAANNITLGTLTTNTASGTVLLTAGGAITDAAPSTPSVVGNTLTITAANSANLDTNVVNVNANNIATTLDIRDQVGALTANVTATGAVNISTTNGNLNADSATGNGVTLSAGGAGSVLRAGAVNANAGAATLSAAAGSIVDDDTVNPGETTVITGATVSLTALDNIGTVTNFVNGAGSSVDVNTAGALSAWVTTTTTDADTDINLNISGNPLIALDAIRLGDILTASRTGEVLLQSPNALNLQNLTNGAINIGASNTASVGYISGATLTLPSAGSPTDTSPFNLLVEGDDVIVSGGSRTIGITANTAVFNSANPGGDYTLLTNVDTLHADVGTVNLTVNEGTGTIALGGITAGTLVVTANTAGGAILDDGDLSGLTEVEAGSVTLTTTGAIGGANALDVDTANLTATTTAGDVSLNSLGATTEVNISAGAGANNVTLAGTGAITDAAGATPSIVANQFNITSAGSVNLDTNVNTLNATGVTGALSIREQTGALAVTNAVGSDVSLSTTGLGNNLTLGSVTATGTVTLTADGSILDGAGATPSVNANVLSVSTNSNVDLDTNVNSLNAVVTGGTANFREQSGALTVTSALGAGANFNISTASGNLNATMVSGQTVTLSAGGTGSDLVLGTVQAATTATLSANDAITDAAGATPSVQANQLNIAGAGSVDLDTNVNTVGTTGLVTSQFNIREQTGALTLASAAAGTVNVSTVAGNLNVTNASPTGNLALTAGGAGSVLTVTNASTGTNATLTSGGAINLGTVTANNGSVTLNAGGVVTDSAGASPSVVADVLAISGAASADLDTNVDSLNASGVTGALVVREQNGDLAVTNAAAGTVDISSVSGQLTNVNATGTTVNLTAAAALSLGTVTSTGTTTLTSGGAITDGAGAAPSVVAGQLDINGAASANLDTDVGTLNASGVTGTFAVREQSGPLTVGNVTAFGDVDVSTVAGDLNVTDATSTTGVLTLTAGGTGNLTVAGTTATGASVDLTSGGNMTLGTANATAGDATLTSGGTITLGTVNATGGVTMNAAGAISDATGTAPSVVASTLTITGAASTDLDTNVDTLTASGVTGTLAVREQTGALALTNADAGTVNVSTVAGNLNITTATGGAVTLGAGGATSNLTLGTVNATGTATLSAGGAISDAAGATPSVTAAALNISSAGSADLDTNVNSLTASTTGALTIREQTGALTVTNATSTGGLVNVSTVGGALTATSVTGNGVTLNAGGATSAMTLGTVNAGAGTATLTAGGAITDAAGATPSVVANALTITGAASADLDTNVNTLTATTSGALAVREQSGALTVANATSTTSTVNVSTLAGAMTVTNAAGTGVTLNAGGAGNALTLGTVNAGTGTATLAAGGAITDGAAVSVTANQLTVTGAGSVDLDTNVNTLNATGVTGALSVREGTGALTVANATSSGGLVTLATTAGALTVTNASGNGVTLTAGGAGNGITLGTVNAGTGTATLTAPGAITDGTTGTALTAGNAVMTASSIGSATNTLETSLNTVTATSSGGGMFIREANDITLTNLSATTANNQDIYVGTTGDITVAQVSNANGRVLLAAGGDVLSTGSGTHITAGNVELRAGLDASGGRIGTISQPLRMSVPATVAGGAGGTGAPVPSVLLLQNESAPNSVEPAQTNQVAIVSGTINISSATFDPAPASTPTNAFLTTTFTTRTAAGDGVTVENVQFNVNGSLNATGQVGLSTQGAATVLAATSSQNAQGEGTLYIDWASFDPDVSLFGTVNPPICLPRDQAEEDDGSAESTGGCATTTAQYDGSFRMPEVKLVITSRGVEWITVRTGQVSVFPLIGQLK
jgi:filamentous hemagglutinin family protein